ncbi:hypothetical protein LguiA_013636 [Lonicera macranthoides]
MEKVKTNDWSQLPYDLIGSIANHLGAIEDFAAFSSVCTSWRSALLREHKQNWSKRCVPWLLLRKRDCSFKYREYFLIPTLNKKKNQYNVVEKGQPLITTAKSCWGSSIGWIFTVSHDNSTALINPLTGVQITLPPLTKSIQRALVFINGTDNNNNNNNIFVMVISEFYDRNRLAFARPGFGEWITLQDHEIDGFDDWGWYKDKTRLGIIDVACYEGMILGVRVNGALVMCETDNISNPRVTNFTPPLECVNFDNLGMVYLIESAGDLLMALLRDKFRKKNDAFQVYKFDIETRRWVELDDLGDRALFLGDNYSISVSQANGVDCIGNCIYSSTRVGLVIFYMKDRRPAVYSFPYFSEKYRREFTTGELASLLNQFNWGPVWLLPSLS